MTPKQLKDARGRLKLTQAALAAKLGVHWMTVSKWERGAQAIPEPAARLLLTLRPKKRRKRRR